MSGYWSKFDFWHVLLTLVPLVTAALGAVVVSRWTRHLGKVVLGYALICVLAALAPVWLPLTSMVPPEGPLRTVLVETKLAFVIGLALIVAAAGRAIQAEASRTA